MLVVIHGTKRVAVDELIGINTGSYEVYFDWFSFEYHMK
jgi:hypothetical protein